MYRKGAELALRPRHRTRHSRDTRPARDRRATVARPARDRRATLATLADRYPPQRDAHLLGSPLYRYT